MNILLKNIKQLVGITLGLLFLAFTTPYSQFSKMSLKTEYECTKNDCLIEHSISYIKLTEKHFSLMFSDIYQRDTLEITDSFLSNKNGLILSFDTSYKESQIIHSALFGTDIITLDSMMKDSQGLTIYKYELMLATTISAGITSISFSKKNGILSYGYYDGWTNHNCSLKAEH